MGSNIDWELISFLKRSNLRQSILKSINSPKTPSDLKKELQLPFNSISRTLNELEGKKLGCFCSPLSCHGDVLLYLIRRIKQDKIIRELWE